MKKEFKTLSEKILKGKLRREVSGMLLLNVEDVKEFIRLLKDRLKNRGHSLCVSDKLIDEEVNAIFGEKLK